MRSQSASFLSAHEEQLRDAGAVMDLPLGDMQVTQLLIYLELLQRWNRTYNLTAIRIADQMLVQHIFDSLVVVRPLDGAMPDQGRVYDVGSGAGLPGVVLAILRPQWQVSCVDAVEKKIAFIRQVAGALRLPNIQALHARVESLAPAHCDVVTSRAFTTLHNFAMLAGHHMAPDGTLVALKGKPPENEIAQLHAAGQWQVSTVQPLTVPQLDAQRCLIWMRREGARSQGIS